MTDFSIPSLPGRLIRVSNPSEPTAGPLDDDPAESHFTPMSFPPFPLSQCAWLTGLAEHFYERHQRCLAVLLILETGNANWITPMLPTQRCYTGGASFQLCKTDFDDLSPACRIGGSFQLTDAATPEESEAQVPSFDGLHQVYAISGNARTKQFFLRTDGTVHLVLPESVLIDDWRQYLHIHRDRLIFP